VVEVKDVVADVQVIPLIGRPQAESRALLPPRDLGAVAALRRAKEK
jgi:hypothetical protein